MWPFPNFRKIVGREKEKNVNPTNHWDQLARELGAEVPARDESHVEEPEVKIEQSAEDESTGTEIEWQTPITGEDEISAREEPTPTTDPQPVADSASAQKSASRSLRSVSTHHWESLAGSLGITVPESELEPEVIVEPEVIQEEDPGRIEPPPEIATAEERPVTEPEARREREPSDSNGEKRGRRGRRRRGGSERSSRRTSAENAQPQAEIERDEAELPVECEIDLSFLDEGADEIDSEPDLESDERPKPESESERRPSRRRSGRKRRRRRESADQPTGDRDDKSSAETPIDWDASSDEASVEPASQKEDASDKQSSRRFPTWGDAVDILVSANIASRERSKPTEGRSRGRRRRSGSRRN